MPGGAARLLRRCFQMEAEACPRTLAECAGLLAEIYREELGRAYPRLEPRAAVDTAAALNNQALSFLDLGMAGRAKDLFLEALELDKNHLAASYNLGLSRWRSGRCDEDDLLQNLEEIKKSGTGGTDWALGWVRIESGYFAEARPYLDAFLAHHTPLPSGLLRRRQEVPSWTEDDFQKLLYTLGCAGFGGLSPEGVRRKLVEIRCQV